jgi:hypothetical protein
MSRISVDVNGAETGTAGAAGHEGGEPIMCMNCGCGQPEDRHKPGDITLSDLKQAARNHDMDVDTAAQNITSAAAELKQAGRI